MTDLKGRVVVITGGNTGIGLGMAHGVGRRGAAVCIWSRTESRNQQAVAELQETGIDAYSAVCDTADETSVQTAMADTLDRYGKVDSLFANAGISQAIPFVDTTLDDWHRIMRTNLDGAFLATRAAARHFIERGNGGSLVIVSSIVSSFGGPQQAAYTTTKNGLIGLGRTLAVELARHRVRANVLLPGWTRTEMSHDLQNDDRFVQITTSRTPARRWAETEDFHDLAAFLADPSLTFHTGDTVTLDGGYSVF